MTVVKSQMSYRDVLRGTLAWMRDHRTFFDEAPIERTPLGEGSQKEGRKEARLWLSRVRLDTQPKSDHMRLVHGGSFPR